MEKEEKTFEVADLEILYNIYGKFYHTIRKEKKLDGDVLFYEIDTDELVDLESYDLHGYKMLMDKGNVLNSLKTYTVEELRGIEDAFESLPPNKRIIEHEFLIELSWLIDSIERQKYNYDRTYPVEQIEIRYSEILKDFIFLYVVFNSRKKKLSYLDMSTGLEVNKEILDLYEFYPRDSILVKDSYSPRETIALRLKMNSEVRNLGKKL